MDFRNEMEQLMNTVKYLKDLVDRREKTWEHYTERENRLHSIAANLTQENRALKEFIKCKQLNLDEVQFDEPTTDISVPPNKEISLLKKIIVKLEKKIRVPKLYNLEWSRRRSRKLKRSPLNLKSLVGIQNTFAISTIQPLRVCVVIIVYKERCEMAPQVQNGRNVQ
ncbi:hypothetical protein NQ317_001960 [Molorchus minor]|uniref:Uncharacterized protein n=1 Tax=Molorchus minor TaxID=1323400 RepID=A0ABQ9JAB1_9CUCU|nr:hypothetical protein NQ317_001960 [Molorchus minor]